MVPLAAGAHRHRRVVGPSVMDVASGSGLLALSPSDLVFESSAYGIQYYDFVLSVCEDCGKYDYSNINSSDDKRAQNESALGTGKEGPLEALVLDQQQSPKLLVGSASKCATRKKFSFGRCATSMNTEASCATTVSPDVSRALSLAQWKRARHASSGDRFLAAGEFSTKTGPGSPIADARKNPSRGYQLFLAKLDAQTNVEWFESARVPAELLTKTGIPATEMAMITMGVLIWRQALARSRLLCLVNQLTDDNTAALEALKRATARFKCVHHVLTIGARRISAASMHSNGSTSSYRSSISSNSSQESMKLRVLMCQSRHELSELPAQAVRETKFLLAPSSNPLLCLCFPLT